MKAEGKAKLKIVFEVEHIRDGKVLSSEKTEKEVRVNERTDNRRGAKSSS